MQHREQDRVASRILAALVLVTLCACSGGPPTTATLDVDGRADATPSIAASGAYVAVAWGARVDSKTDVFLATSRDGGATFAAPVQVNDVPGEARLGGEFPPRVVLSPRTGGGTPDIVVLWTARGANVEIKTAKSRDGGRTFDAPVVLQSAGADGDRGWPSVAVDPTDGRIHAVWLDHRGLAAAAGTLAHQHHAASESDGVAMAQKSGLYYASAGDTTSPEREVVKGVCYCCKTALATGSGGELYAAWRHVYPGNLRDIAFSMSPGHGEPFSPPVRVSEDGWEINGCPDDGPAVAVDAGGTVHVVWPTVIQENGPQGALFYASTRDGRTFSSRMRIPTLGGVKPAHPQIAIDANGRILVGWDEQVSGQRVAAVRELRTDAEQQPSFGEIVTLGSGIYPALAAADTGFVAAWTAPLDPARVEVRRLKLP
jgi:hypothetical protein